MATTTTATLLYAASVSPVTTSSQPDDEITKSKAWHGPDGRFTNPWPSFAFPVKFWAVPWHFVSRQWSGAANKPDIKEASGIPVHTPNFLSGRKVNPNLRATWLGHACYYVEFPTGIRVLFDPVFEERCSPVQVAGPKRYTKQPCQVKDIPFVDAVVISHCHYDHLSQTTVTEIAKHFPQCHFFVPLGNKSWFKSCGIEKCTELDWWQESELTLNLSSDKTLHEIQSIDDDDDNNHNTTSSPISARIRCLPCQHMANRSTRDQGKTLWSSWSIHSGSKSVYFGGDTGYRTVPKSADGKDDWGPEYADLPVCPGFKYIGEHAGPFDLGLLPIGAYDPRWLMSPLHSNTRDAVEIFKDTKCNKALAMHWGTWVLTEEDVMEPPRKLKENLKVCGIPEEGVFDVCGIGESREF